MKLILVYATDVWHSKTSKDLLGIATGKTNEIVRKKAIDLINRFIKKNKYVPLDDDDLHLLETINQTQGYSGDEGVGYEFVIDPVEANTLLF